MDNKKKLYINTVTSLLYQLVSLIIGLVLPRLILGAFGSDINGLTTSITRFLSFISFMEMGIGPVIQSNLYGPLAKKNKEEVAKIYVSAERFYKRIAYIFLIYIIALVVVYPNINRQFDFGFTASLIVIISISTFAQYFFGLTNQVLLSADQKTYVGSIIQIVTIVLNAVACIFLIRLGCSIHIVKLVSSIVFVLRPVALNLYVRNHYDIDRKIKIHGEPIKQKWNGFYQHLAGIVCGETDVILLTIFSTNQNVSIYSVYYMVIIGLTNLLIQAVSGLTSYWGNAYALKKNAELARSFDNVEHIIHFSVTLVFTCCSILIEPFVRVYVMGINDAAAYSNPLFGVLLSLAYAFQCLRIPYDRITKAAGHYKQTQNGALISMIINLLVSIILVRPLGLIGVAMGTIAAMLYHTLYLVFYLKKAILHRGSNYFIKHLLTDIFIFLSGLFCSRFIDFSANSYLIWVFKAFIGFCIVLFISIIVNMVCYPHSVCVIIETLKNKFLRKKGY